MNASTLTAEAAAPFFEKFRKACSTPESTAWGMPMHGPLLILDEQGGKVMANEPDGACHSTPFPACLVASNSAQRWLGKWWATVRWEDLQGTSQEALAIIIHESFHRVQNERGMVFPPGSCEHLDTAQGATLLLLECRALWKAWNSENPLAATHDALALREWRHRLFPLAREEEDAQEALEGSAEYVGLHVAHGEAAGTILKTRMESLENSPGLTRSFPYVSGALLCFLLDRFRPGWKASYWKEANLAQLLGESLAWNAPSDLAGPIEVLCARYDGDGLALRQAALERARSERVQAVKSRFVEGPILEIHEISLSYDPRRKIAIPGHGDFFEPAEIKGPWGKVTCSAGALVDFTKWRASIPAPPQALMEARGRRLAWEGFTLELAEGFAFSVGTRPGTWCIRRAEKPAKG